MATDHAHSDDPVHPGRCAKCYLILGRGRPVPNRRAGGLRRTAVLTAEQRAEIGRIGAQARWGRHGD